MRARESNVLLVTGAAGFVGSAVVRLARSRGIHTIAHARSPASGIDVVADLSNPMAVEQIPMEVVTGVIHCAAAIPSRSHEFSRDNCLAALNLAAKLDQAPSLRSIVNLSSISVYSRPLRGHWLIAEEGPVVELGDKTADRYAKSKRAVELEFESFAKTRGHVECVHIRASSIYGPGMVKTTLLPVLVASARQNKPLILRGPRDYMQNFIHVGDVAALAIAVVNPEISPVPPIINAFSDDTFGLFQLARLIRARLGSSSPIVDETVDDAVPIPKFVNVRAKTLHRRFINLSDGLLESA
jgi:nucleoside-diphosphate-sugar epimerase